MKYADNFELMYGYTGNGCVVYNKAEQENGDYKKLAYIDEGGTITWYVPIMAIPGLALLNIEHVANVHYENFKDKNGGR